MPEPTPSLIPDAAAPGQSEWTVLADHAQPPPGGNPSAATLRMPAPDFPQAYKTPSEILARGTAAEPAAPADANAKTMLVPAPHFSSPAPEAVAQPSAPVAAAPSVTPSSITTSETIMLAPPPDNPFGAGESAVVQFAQPAPSRSLKMPAPSGANWRTVMNEIPTEQPKAVLSATGLIKWFGKRQVVRGVDVEVGAGEIVGLLGRNGAGKTTTFRMIMGLLHPDGGRVTYENRDVTRLPMYARANRGIGYLAQQPSIFQRLTVEENLMAVLELQEPSRKMRKQRMEELIKSLGLEKVRLSQASNLSGGERRRLEIARAMSLRPRVVLFDEPFAGIDPITVNEIQGILKDLKKQGVGVLVTDHNVRETLTITDRTYIMDDGKIWIHGHPREIVENEEARSRYLGHEFRLDF